MEYSNALIHRVLVETQVIAMVGASQRTERPSYGVMRFLLDKGYTVYPVNPSYRGEKIHGQTVLESLIKIPENIDMVNIFRRSNEVETAVSNAITNGAKYIWMQLGVINQAEAKRAAAKGLTVIMDRCPVIEYKRLSLG